MGDKTIWSLQVLRFFAALMVVYIHAMQSAIGVTGSSGLVPINIAAVGLAGVDIFFVISGVIIATVAPGKSALEFAWARLTRIVPLYLICSIIPLATAVAAGTFGLRSVVATFLLWPATDQMTAPALGLAWTLCYEMLFYAAATLVLLNRRWLYLLLIVFAAAFTLRSAGPVFQFLGNPIILEFLAGVAIARAPRVRYGAVALPIGAAALIAAGAFGLIDGGSILQFLIGEGAPLRVAVMGIPAALIVYGTVHIEAKQGVLTYLGGASYSLYLVHVFPTTATRLFSHAPFTVAPETVVIVGLGLSLVIAWRVHELVERPLLNALRGALSGASILEPRPPIPRAAE